MREEQKRKMYLSPTFFSFCLCSDLLLPSHLPLLPFSKTLHQTLIPSILKLSALHLLFLLNFQYSDFSSRFPKFDSRRRGMTKAYATLPANGMPEAVGTSA